MWQLLSPFLTLPFFPHTLHASWFLGAEDKRGNGAKGEGPSSPWLLSEQGRRSRPYSWRRGLAKQGWREGLGGEECFLPRLKGWNLHEDVGVNLSGGGFPWSLYCAH